MVCIAKPKSAAWMVEPQIGRKIERNIEDRLRLAVQSAVLRLSDILNDPEEDSLHLRGIKTQKFLEEIEAHQRSARKLRKALEDLEAVLVL